MFAGKRRGVCVFTICLFLLSGRFAGAEPCTISEPSDELGGLFTECEDGTAFEGYRTNAFDTDDSNDTPTKVVRDDFIIDQMQVMTIGLDFSKDWDIQESNRQAKYYRNYCTGRVRYKTIMGNSSGALAEGWAYGFFATELAWDPNKGQAGDFIDCDIDTMNIAALRRPGVLFLPGIRNPSSPSFAAKLAAMFSAETTDGREPGLEDEVNEGKVFLLMIAPPGHMAISETQAPCGGEAFCTRQMEQADHPDAEYASWKTSWNGDHVIQEGDADAGLDSVNAAILELLLNGFMNAGSPKPARQLLWGYAESAMRAINLFDKYFATNNWVYRDGTTGKMSLAVTGFSLGGITSLIVNEADPGDRISSVSTFAAHVGLDDNFRTRADNLGLTMLTADAVWIPTAVQAPFIAWDCDRMGVTAYRDSLEAVYPQLAIDRMDASCEMSRYFSPLHYDPAFPTRPILLTQGSQDEPFAVRGMERTWRYLDDYLGAGYAKMHLSPDVDHKHYMGYPGLGVTPFGLVDYFFMTVSPSEDMRMNSYPTFDELTTDYETFLNADWINPSGLFDNLDADETLGLNRTQSTIRHFILSHSQFVNPPADREETPVPDAPVSPTTLEPGVQVKRTAYRYWEYMGPAHDAYEYEMIACFDPTKTSGDPEIYFHTSPDRFWHAMPACLGESSGGDYDLASVGDASYTVDLTSNYQFNTPCAKRSIDGQSAKYVDKCKDESSDEDVSRFHDGFLGVDILEVDPKYPVPEGYECRTFTLRFDDVVDSDPPIAPTQLPNQFVAWAELRERDELGYLAGATTPISLVSRKLVAADTPRRYDQCLRPIVDDLSKAWRVYPDYV